jgi:hypothetical protein
MRQKGGHLKESKMAQKNRIPLQVSPEFKKRLDEIQKQMMMSKGVKPSLREITEDIVSSPFFKDIEKNLIKTGNINMDIKIKFDKRYLQ